MNYLCLAILSNHISDSNKLFLFHVQRYVGHRRRKPIWPLALTASTSSSREPWFSSCRLDSPCSSLGLSARRTWRMFFYGTYLIVLAARLPSGRSATRSRMVETTCPSPCRSSATPGFSWPPRASTYTFGTRPGACVGRFLMSRVLLTLLSVCPLPT